jgi:single-strand DNA-binding protein
MNDTMMTIVGNVVDTPRLRQTKNGHVVTNFRIASTSRRFDREQGTWVDDSTLFITVTCWRGFGQNVDKSLHKGQPVLVYGRYYMREYKVEEQLRTSYELEAVAVGHDLARGTSEFTRVRQPAPVAVARDEDGIPIDDSDHWIEDTQPPAAGYVTTPGAGEPEAARELAPAS